MQLPRVDHTYLICQRGHDLQVSTYNYVDLTPLGWQEEGLGSPEFRHYDRDGAAEEAHR